VSDHCTTIRSGDAKAGITAAQQADGADQASKRKAGRPQKTLYNTENDIQDFAPVGTSRAAALRRLRKDRPDLHARVFDHIILAHFGRGWSPVGFTAHETCSSPSSPASWVTNATPLASIAAATWGVIPIHIVGSLCCKTHVSRSAAEAKA